MTPSQFAAMWEHVMDAYLAGVDAAKAGAAIEPNPFDRERQSHDYGAFRAGWRAVQPATMRRPWYAEPVVVGEDRFAVARAAFRWLVAACVDRSTKLPPWKVIEIAERLASRAYDRRVGRGRYVFAFALLPEERDVLLPGGAWRRSPPNTRIARRTGCPTRDSIRQRFRGVQPGYTVNPQNGQALTRSASSCRSDDGFCILDTLSPPARGCGSKHHTEERSRAEIPASEVPDLRRGHAGG